MPKGSLPLQQRAANLLLLAPGAVQIYYGDESGRPLGPTGSDPLQGTRSDMNWRELLGEKPRCWPTGNGWGSSALATRRSAAACKTPQPHAAYYAFSRRLGDDKVMVVWAGERSQ